VRLPLAPALAGWLCASLLAARADAFCRTTTCDPQREADGCDRVDGCATRGLELYWPDACVTYAVQSSGSPARGVSAFEADQAMRGAFSAWLGVDCQSGGQPSMGVIPLGGASCDQVEFNAPVQGRGGAPNANIVIFRDEEWPYPDEFSVIARTSLTFDPKTGAIFDADIEINSFQNEFSTSEEAISNDLQAVLTHEVGHFLGLDHSEDDRATMRWNYDLANLGARTLSDDDRAGICSIYAPLEEPLLECPGNTGPWHGFSRECGTPVDPEPGCALEPGSGTPSHPSLTWPCAALLLVLARRRQRWPG
jgi:hypothetical protein